MNQKKGSILITDSGLGGLSICADLVSRLHHRPLFEDASVIYFNAWPEQNRGYNKFGTVAERIRIFDQALIGMEKYHPDLIMIACNTLSILYDRTEFSRYTDIPVIDIIDFGAHLIYDKMIAVPDSNVLILGTLTTIAEDRHKAILMDKGIEASRIATQACDGLATAIEMDAAGKRVVELADRYIREAASKIDPKRDKLFAGLCCTHFGYSLSIIEEKIKQYVTENVILLNPNRLMSRFLFEPEGEAVSSESKIRVKVVSKVRVDDMKIESITKMIRYISPKTAEALINYEYIPDLFVF